MRDAMVSKAQIQRVRALQQRSERERQGLYVIEGDQLVTDYLEAGQRIDILLATKGWLRGLSEDMRGSVAEILEVSDRELSRMSSLVTAHDVLAVVRKPPTTLPVGHTFSGLTVALESVRDPGNVGTILRTAAWFGVPEFFLSADCVDPFNPKVVQAAMGATIHVRIYSVELETLLESAAACGYPVYGTSLEGASIYEADLAESGMVVFGNEARGLSESVLERVPHRLRIPSWSEAGAGLDSLNVAMAAAIVCSEFRRRGRPSGSLR
jgi:TrmH family RNA methyltransferase